jgi:ubiquinone biosynthesis protein
MAAGTIAQVHKATLADGSRVVVKVQRPTAEGDIMRDLGLFQLFAEKTADRPAFRHVIDMPAIVGHLSESLQRELDFTSELESIERMRRVLKPYSRLDVPAVYKEYSTPRLLVMQEIQGVPIRKSAASPERTEAARQLLESYYRQILTDGFFHADPHPGNLTRGSGCVHQANCWAWRTIMEPRTTSRDGQRRGLLLGTCCSSQNHLLTECAGGCPHPARPSPVLQERAE